MVVMYRNLAYIHVFSLVFVKPVRRTQGKRQKITETPQETHQIGIFKRIRESAYPQTWSQSYHGGSLDSSARIRGSHFTRRRPYHHAAARRGRLLLLSAFRYLGMSKVRAFEEVAVLLGEGVLLLWGPT